MPADPRPVICAAVRFYRADQAYDRVLDLIDAAGQEWHAYGPAADRTERERWEAMEHLLTITGQYLAAGTLERHPGGEREPSNQRGEGGGEETGERAR